MFKQLMPALKMVLLLTVVAGLIYPGVVTGLCQVLFHDKSNGSLIVRSGHVVGSSLLGQKFAKPEYFHPRLSAAGNDGYDASASGGSNLGVTSQKLADRMKASADQFRKENPAFEGPIPADALTASASGLDPHISEANAHAQAARVAKARGVDPSIIQAAIAAATQQRDLGILGEPRVNVLELNLKLDRQAAR